MSHPALVTLDGRSAPRALISGDQIRDFSLPTGTRVLYPRRPLPSVGDVAGALRRTLDEPNDSAALRTRVRTGMRVAVALDAQFIGVPQAGTDVSATALEVLLPLLTEWGATVDIIVATGIHRRLRPHELRHLLGPNVYRQRQSLNVHLHDPEAANALVEVGTTDDGWRLQLNHIAAQADLLVAVAITGHPFGGAQATCALGLGGYGNARAVYAPSEPTTPNLDHQARLASVCEVISTTTPVFAVEFTLDSRYQASDFEFLRKNEDDLNGSERLRLQALAATSRRLPAAVRAQLLSRVTPRAGATGVFAGSAGPVHECAKARYFEQHAVPIGAPADVLVVGLGPSGPFNHSAPLNPLLLNHLALAWLFAQCQEGPLVRRGGTMILLHPCTDRFDHLQHAPHIKFVRHLLTETQDVQTLHSHYEERFARDPALLEMFRTGHAYHPAHSFMLWYQCQIARHHLRRVIVVGADNEYVPRLLGYETAASLEEALYRARDGSTRNQDVLCLHNYPSAVGRVSRSTT